MGPVDPMGTDIFNLGGAGNLPPLPTSLSPTPTKDPNSSWNKHYVAGLFSAHEKNLKGEAADWEVQKEVIRHGYSIYRTGAKKTEAERKYFVRCVYYKSYQSLYAKGEIMVPEETLNHAEIWGSIAYTSFPGSDVDVYPRKIIEEALATLKTPTECIRYYRQLRSKFASDQSPKSGRQNYGFFVLPIAKMLGKKMHEIRINIPGTSSYDTYCPDGIPVKFMEDIPRNWIYPNQLSPVTLVDAPLDITLLDAIRQRQQT